MPSKEVAKAIDEVSRHQVEATPAEVETVLQNFSRYRKRPASPLWIAIPVFSDWVFTAGIAYLAHPLM